MRKRQPRICSVPGCGDTVLARGWCSKHYNRWYKRGKRGDPAVAEFRRSRDMSDEELYSWLVYEYRTVCIGPLSSPCWISKYRQAEDGYPTARIGNSRLHKFILEKRLGRKLAASEVTRHRCDVRNCVRPSHLEPGTRQDNMQDMVDRDRQAHGSENGLAKLTEGRVLVARRWYASGRWTQQALADKFGVCRRTMVSALKGETWKRAA